MDDKLRVMKPAPIAPDGIDAVSLRQRDRQSLCYDQTHALLQRFGRPSMRWQVLLGRLNHRGHREHRADHGILRCGLGELWCRCSRRRYHAVDALAKSCSARLRAATIGGGMGWIGQLDTCRKTPRNHAMQQSTASGVYNWKINRPYLLMADVPRQTFSDLTNPYAPSTADHPGSLDWSAANLHMFAGSWLIVSGILHFIAMNLLSKPLAAPTVDWTPLTLSGLGVFVALQFRVAIAFTRLIGSFAVLGIVLASIVMFIGVEGEGELVYGEARITNPQPWQELLLLTTMVATIVPPWWMLQRALSGNNAVNRSGRKRVF